MGQARNRGSFEQRKAEGIAKQKARQTQLVLERELKRIQDHKKEVARREALTPERRAREDKAAKTVNLFTTMTIGMLAFSPALRDFPRAGGKHEEE